MHILKKITLVLAATLLPLVLLSFGLTWSLHQVFGGPGHIESALTNSGVYNTIVGNALDQAQSKQDNPQQPGPGQPQNNQQGQPSDQNNGGDKGGNNIPINDPQIKAIIEQAVPPQYLQTQVNQVLNSVYTWMQGKQPNLTFSVDLSGPKQALADGLATYTQQKLASLPVCPANQLPNSDVDPFSATCVPQGFDVANAASKIRNNVSGGDFLKDPVFTADSYKVGDGQTLQQKLQKVPGIYQKIGLGIYVLGGLLLLLSAAVVLCSATWRYGVRKLANIFLPIGITLTVFAIAISVGLQRASDVLAKGAGDNKAVQQSVFSVAKILANDVRTYWLGFGITLLVLSAAGYTIFCLAKPKHPNGEKDQLATAKAEKDKEGSEAPEDEPSDIPKPDAAQKPHAPKPKSKKIDI
ncbi:MAG TPA: hypothetical protein VLH84_04085 [Patescibacteria group bacterium]|nr:hypothetical protein [Patescibacteria group bacterium]